MSESKVSEVKRSVMIWTKPLMDAGFLIFPSIILKKQHALGLEPMDINIIVQLATYWWRHDNPPFPSKKTLAEAIGVDVSTIRRRISALEKAGFIKREKRITSGQGQKSNIYRLDGLIEHATKFAKEEIEAREKDNEEKRARRSSKKPVLSMVEN
jgi:predicted transcriptional regulator